MRHLLGIEGMQRSEVDWILERAAFHHLHRTSEPKLAGAVVANLFFEPSTRTRVSFEIAAGSLGARVVNWTVAGSSASKGESLLDTARNVAAMGPKILVVRHSSSGAASFVAQAVGCSVVNAGDGQHEHPSQALLDAFTLLRRWGSLAGRRILIAGDVLHSRVARSNIALLRLLGATVWLSGPAPFLPPSLDVLGAQRRPDFGAALQEADAVMLLRVQRERQSESLFPSEAEYHRRWGLTEARARLLQPHALLLHPGPVNRGLEVAPEVADGLSSVILEQVENGIAVRKAILEALS